MSGLELKFKMHGENSSTTMGTREGSMNLHQEITFFSSQRGGDSILENDIVKMWPFAIQVEQHDLKLWGE